KYQLLEYLETVSLSNDPQDPLIRCLIHYCPPLLRKNYEQNILTMPDIHKKAIIACYISSQLVYKKGLDWNPSISDILPLIANDPDLFED
ncbi:MAG: hypothetical protein K2X08_01330, partial [Chlamydiales bacterium]|nr:hypothetical protein [Chlamydiales bacterium]